MRGIGEPTHGADGSEHLAVHCCQDAAILLGDGEHGGGVRGVRVLNEARGQVTVEYSIGLIGKGAVDPVGAGERRGAFRGDGNIERNV